jgi:hypothetical protein
MLLVYEGPPDAYDSEVAQALSLARDHATVELPDERPGAAEDATITATDVAGDASGYLEPGRVYDLPGRLAHARLETSAWWTRVTKISDEQLRRLAAERGVKGRTKLDRKDLAKAVSQATAATLPDPSPPTEAPAGGDTSPTPGSTTPAAGPGPETGAAPATTAPTTGGNP